MEPEKPQPPTFYANVVTMILNVDEFTVELRCYLPAHKEQMAKLSAADVLKPLPPPSPNELMELEPIARVVLTYSAAKALMEYLVKAFPPTEDLRRKGSSG